MTPIKGLSRKWTVLLILLFPSLCLAQGAHRISQVLVRGNGVTANVAPNAAITVCSPGTHCGTVATIYSDLNLTQPIRQPVIADASGNYSYYVPTGCYDEKVSVVGSQPLLTFNVCLISSVAGSGSVTAVSVVTANGFQGTVANPTTTPAITISPDSTHYFPTLTDEANWNAKAPTASPTFTGTTTVSNLTITGTCTGCGGGGGAVSSVFGRTGAVTAQTGDYSLANISAGASPTGLFDFSGATQLKLPSHAGYTAAASGEIGYDTTNGNIHFNFSSTDLIALGFPSASPPVSGHCAQFTEIGAWWELTDAGAACGSGGGGSGTVTSVSVVTANGVSASVANPTTTPALTFTLGAITPTQVTTGFITTTGNAACTGCGGGSTLTEGVAPSGSFIGAGLDTYWADSASHHVAVNLNNGGTAYLPTTLGGATPGDLWIVASNGYDLVDGGAPPGTGITNGTAGFVSLFGSSTTINATSPIDCGITTTGVWTSSEPVAVGDSGGTLSHSIIINPANGVAPSVTTGTWTLAMSTAAITGQTWVVPSAPATGIVFATNTSGVEALSYVANLPNANLATQSANTVLGALTATTPSGLAMPPCSGASNALIWTSGTGFGCNTISGGGTPAYPLTITGGVSGGVVYSNSATQLTVSPAGTVNTLMAWGGAGAAPFSSHVTDNGTDVISSLPVECGAGTATSAGCGVGGTANGLSGVSGNLLLLQASATRAAVVSSGVDLGTNVLEFGTTPTAAADTGLSRVSAGVVGVGTGAAGSTAGTLDVATLNLGASGTLGTLTIGNATSGTVSLVPVTGALGTVTASLPANTGTLAELNLAQTWSALQTFGTNISIGGVTATGATGTSNVVFSNSPTLVTPALGTPSSATLTNATGLPISGITGLGTGVGTALAVAGGSAGALGVLVGSGTFTLGTSAIASGACATVVTVATSGVATTDTIEVGFNGDPTAVTGYGASATGAVLSIYPYPTSGNANVKVCNSTASSITPGALTLNFRVYR